MLTADADWDRRLEESYVANWENLACLLESKGVSWDLAMDAVHEVFLRWRRMPPNSRSQPQPGKEREWLAKCVWRAAVTRHRRQCGRTACEEKHTRARRRQEARPLLDGLVDQELLQVIERILEHGATDRMCRIFAWRQHGVRYRQIAENESITVARAKLEFRKVIALLRKELSRLGW
jgi:DNA-directed RNA polymerase specialized sigma24 family protein